MMALLVCTTWLHIHDYTQCQTISAADFGVSTTAQCRVMAQRYEAVLRMPEHNPAARETRTTVQCVQPTPAWEAVR